jgi:hypothetical protein
MRRFLNRPDVTLFLSKTLVTTDGAFLAQAYFEPFDSQRATEGQQQIQTGYGDPDFESEVGGGHQLHTLKRQFLNRDDRNDGRVFDRRDELAGQGRQNTRHGLGQNNVTHLL